MNSKTRASIVRGASWLLAGQMVSACVTNETSPPSLATPHEVAMVHDENNGGKGHAPWYDGSVEAAFAAAKAANKPIFLYWGAVWCPPCNEIKSEVFSKPRFAELVEPMVAVYLDGDTERAQIWGEKLKVSGYPTMLLLSPGGEELMRMSETVNLSEFEAALASAMSGRRPFADTLETALAGKASDEEWRTLAYYSWGQAELPGMTPAELLKARKTLADKVPTHLKVERAALAASLLSAAATTDDKGATGPVRQAIRLEADRYLDAMFTDSETRRAARRAILYDVGAIASFVTDDQAATEVNQLKTRWLEAAAELGADESLSVDNRLWAVYPELAFYSMGHDGEAVSEQIRWRVEEAARQADERAKSGYERHSVISGAAFLLRKVGDFEGARRLLDKELDLTDTPWYYQSSYANLEREAGNTDEALVWAERARTSAKGRATRLQWIVEDLLLTSKIKTSEQTARLAALLTEYYETAFNLKDGFSGRNASRAQTLARDLKPFATAPEVNSVIRRYQSHCDKVGGGAGNICREHFKTLL